MKKSYYILFLVLVFAACNQNKKDRKQISTTENQIDKTTELNNDIPKSTNGITIEFSDFKLIIDNLETLDGKSDFKSNSDTVNIMPDLGELLSGNPIRVVNNSDLDIEIQQRFQNSVTIMNEGPHCDLTDWKNYVSPWTKIKRIDKSRFVADSITNDQMERFIPVDIDEFKNAVKNHCGDDWADLVKNIDSINDYPCEIGTSKVELLIRLFDDDKKVITEKLIDFDIAMGC